MTEAEWIRGTHPREILRMASTRTRKLRLFTCACCRQVWDLLTDERFQMAVQKLEEYADNLLAWRLLSTAESIARAARNDLGRGSDGRSTAASVVVCAAMSHPHLGLVGALRASLSRSRGITEDEALRLVWAPLHDIFGNPFRPVIFAPEWRTDTVIALARQMYESRDFGAMPILADALQDAGCDAEEVLTHCRDANQGHARGCWVVDLVLGKE